jgi:ParB/RepB/Spo0J family partition protein
MLLTTMDRMGEARESLATVSIDLIAVNREQVRQHMDEDQLGHLTESIRRHGVLQPVRLRRLGHGFAVIAGHRRLAAARRAGLRELPAIIVDADEGQVLVESLIENIQREDLNPDDRGEALRRLRVSTGAQSWDEVARLIGISRRHVHHLLNVSRLPEPIREDVRAGVVTEKHARALLRLRKHPQAQMQLWQRITRERVLGDEAIRISKQMLTETAAGGGGARPVRPYPVPTLEQAVADLAWLVPRATMREVRPLRSQLETLIDRLTALVEDAFDAREIA